ncbi:hypothetical protein LDENG_00126620 [Lucifuga dentata]|nr:hypothetical protein LDENG_00126620 [Lucifuga dentata]
MRTDHEVLQIDHKTLTESNTQLQTNYSTLQKEKDELQTLFSALTADRDQLQKNYYSLQTDKEQLQSRYNTLSMGENQLRTSYTSLWKEKTRLQTNLHRVEQQLQTLQTNYKSLTTRRDQLEKEIDKMVVKITAMNCETGWRKFEMSCYFVSSEKKNWTKSQQACEAKGADLVIINSRKEQAFINELLESGENSWIGLSDTVTEGTWMWVDGTPLTTAYWQPGQPNSFSGNQDCGEMVHKPSGSVGEWNDDGCFSDQLWICEK